MQEQDPRDGERAPYDPMPHGPTEVGVGPWEGPWPEGEQFDPDLLRDVVPVDVVLDRLQLAWWESGRCHVMAEWALGG